MVIRRKDNNGKVLNTGENQRKDGRYSFVYKDSDGAKRYIYASDLKTLREKEEKIKADLNDGIISKGANLTLNELFKLYIGIKKKIKDTTRANYLRTWKSYVENNLGKQKIDDLKPIHIKTFYGNLSDDGLAYSTIGFVHSLVFGCLEMALDNDFIRKNPAKHGLEDLKNDTKQKVALTDSQVKDLIKFCSNSIYNIYVPFLQIAFGTCCRCGELTGLTWDNVDIKNRTITIDHQLVYKKLDDSGCKFHITTPKTDAGCRTIPMTETVYHAFLELKKQNLALGRFCNMEVDGYTNFCFLTSTGAPFPVGSINHALYRIEKAYNKANPEKTIPHLSAHILRHTGCSIYANAGLNTKSLQSIMGHSDARITMNIYAHSDLENVKAEIKKLDDVVNL